MRQLTNAEIEKFAGLPRVKRIAVENFLSSVEYNKNKTDAILNMLADAKIYKWNTETVDAIREGICLACK